VENERKYERLMHKKRRKEKPWIKCSCLRMGACDDCDRSGVKLKKA